MVSAARKTNRVLLVEDDRETRQLVSRALADVDYQVTSVDRAAAATAAIRDGDFSAVILDVRLPDSDGITLCREWRERGLRVPILMLTARTDVASRVEGLTAGADDYLGKPFALAELRARLNAILRRGAGASRRLTLRAGDLSLDFASRSVRRGDAEIPLTRRELDVLERLVRGGGHAVSRDDLLDEIWGEATPESASSLEVIVGRLRRKLDATGSEKLIRTLRGFGYAFAARLEEENP